MENKKSDKIELYAFIGVVALTFFLGYDGFVNESVMQGGSRRTKVALYNIIVGSIWRMGDKHPWAYILFRGVFLVIALWMGYKIFRAVYKNER